MVDMTKQYFNGKSAIQKARENNENKFVFVALEIDVNLLSFSLALLNLRSWDIMGAKIIIDQ